MLTSGLVEMLSQTKLCLLFQPPNRTQPHLTKYISECLSTKLKGPISLKKRCKFKGMCLGVCIYDSQD